VGSRALESGRYDMCNRWDCMLQQTDGNTGRQAGSPGTQDYRTRQTMPQLLLYTIHYGPAKGNRNMVPQKPQALTGYDRSVLCSSSSDIGLRGAGRLGMLRPPRCGVARSAGTVLNRVRDVGVGGVGTGSPAFRAALPRAEKDDHGPRLSSVRTPINGDCPQRRGGGPSTVHGGWWTGRSHWGAARTRGTAE